MQKNVYIRNYVMQFQLKPKQTIKYVTEACKTD